MWYQKESFVSCVVHNSIDDKFLFQHVLFTGLFLIRLHTEGCGWNTPIDPALWTRFKWSYFCVQALWAFRNFTVTWTESLDYFPSLTAVLLTRAVPSFALQLTTSLRLPLVSVLLLQRCGLRHFYHLLRCRRHAQKAQVLSLWCLKIVTARAQVLITFLRNHSHLLVSASPPDELLV